jgi:predicted DNA-binding helix-hairpin-helix protein
MRVPGIGPKGADKILKARRQRRLTDLTDLRKLDIRAPEQAAPYILLDGRAPTYQLEMFSDDSIERKLPGKLSGIGTFR